MPARRPVTLADVARLAGVAKSTASYAFSDPGRLSPQTTKAVLEAAEQLGYFGPSALGRALASGRTHVVAVVTRALLEAPETDPHALQVIDGLSRELASLGYGVLLLPPVTDDASRRLHATALYDAAVTVRRIDGIAATDEILEHRGVPFVKLDGVPDEHRAVSMDHFGPMREILAAVVEAGHSRIATITLRMTVDFERTKTLAGADVEVFMRDLDSMGPHRVPRERLLPFKDLGIVPSHLASCSIVSKDEAYAVARDLLTLPRDQRPTAIVCQADTFAWGVWEAARDLGLDVPGDVSITGFDGITGGVYDHMNLTTVEQDGALKGRLVASWLVNAVEQGVEPEPVPLDLRVRWGSSVAQLAAGASQSTSRSSKRSAASAS